MIKPSFKNLEALLPIMGAKRIQWKSDGITRQRAEFIRNLTTTGIEIKDKNDVTIRNDGLLEINGEQVVIYIKDHGMFSIGGILNKFHLSDCSTIKGMKYAGRYARYVATQRKDGLFLIDLRGEEVEAKLYPCINCMKKLRYKNYQGCSRSKRKEIIQDFDMEEFFKLYEARFESKTRYTDKTYPNNEYAPNQSELSEQEREKNNWTCEKCGGDFSNDRGNLHVHHINGNRFDNNSSNLKVLCKTCHSQEPYHGHMR